MNARERIALIQQFGRTYRGFMSAFEGRVGQPLPRWRVLMILHENDPASVTRPWPSKTPSSRSLRRIGPGAARTRVFSGCAGLRFHAGLEQSVPIH